MALISCQRLRIAFGGPPLLDDANLQIERGERVGLLGRNGEGKSTLLEIIAGSVVPDGGEVLRESGARISIVEQQVPDDLDGSALSVIASGALAAGAGSNHAGSHLTESHHTESHHAERLCSLLHLDPHQPFADLSGGQKRRALLGRALVVDPDVLLLDEPTNHLDLDHIEQLETILLRFHGSVIFVTHDRTFLQRIATRIVELDRGRLTSWSCDYPTYVARKEEQFANEEKEWELFDQKLAREEAWIRRGIKARRTRNEGRVRALEQLRRDRSERRERVGQVRLNLQQGGRSTAKIVEVKEASFAYPPGGSEAKGATRPGANGPVIRAFSSTIYRGDRVGVIGPNGCGKTTLLNLLIGELSPQQGSVKHGGRLEIAYFDQHRVQLDSQATLADAVADGNEFVVMGSERRHIYAYLEDFLFSAEAAHRPVWTLSGGERNRLLLAKLFTQPANVLVLDEPTNDLDTDTLELLESLLLDYEGTALIVSHDRTFLDNLCTSTLVFEGEGSFKEYVGGYSDWQRTLAKREPEQSASGAGGNGKRRGNSPKPKSDDGKPKKLSYKERQEWTALPGQIEELEQELHALQVRLSDPAFFRGDPGEIRSVRKRVTEIPVEIESAFERWGALDERA